MNQKVEMMEKLESCDDPSVQDQETTTPGWSGLQR